MTARHDGGSQSSAEPMTCPSLPTVTSAGIRVMPRAVATERSSSQKVRCCCAYGPRKVFASASPQVMIQAALQSASANSASILPAVRRIHDDSSV
ncbi:MAG: hypothetical protein M5U19_21985 [Microthrixaceae bacterium]|nr:hypothetical protein [Microthrixaceae bacterium]